LASVLAGRPDLGQLQNSGCELVPLARHYGAARPAGAFEAISSTAWHVWSGTFSSRSRLKRWPGGAATARRPSGRARWRPPARRRPARVSPGCGGDSACSAHPRARGAGARSSEHAGRGPTPPASHAPASLPLLILAFGIVAAPCFGMSWLLQPTTPSGSGRRNAGLPAAEVTIGSPDTIARGFAESQQSRPAALISMAKATAADRQFPAVMALPPQAERASRRRPAITAPTPPMRGIARRPR
jgi:hypothetical protein